VCGTLLPGESGRGRTNFAQRQGRGKACTSVLGWEDLTVSVKWSRLMLAKPNRSSALKRRTLVISFPGATLVSPLGGGKEMMASSCGATLVSVMALLVVGHGECWLAQTGAGLRLAGLRECHDTCRGGKWERIEGGGGRSGISSSAWDLAMHAEPQAGKVRGGVRPLVNAAMTCGKLSSAAAALLSLSAMAAAEGGVYIAAVDEAAGGVDQVFLLLRLLSASCTSESTFPFLASPFTPSPRPSSYSCSPVPSLYPSLPRTLF
jgi:hypothetical protein